jgi:phosphopantothenoylcysteine synthetase/decarboxylase
VTEETDAIAVLKRNILVCAGGSIGVAHLPAMLSHIAAVFPEVHLRVVMTAQAASIVPPSTFAVLTGSPAHCAWHREDSCQIPHVQLADWAELMLVMPATANLIGKAASGIADDLLTTCLIAADCPIVFVPCMNSRMWQNPLVQRNVRILRDVGAHVLEPAAGLQASTGQVAVGSLPSLRELMQQLIRILAPNLSRSHEEIRHP